MTQKCGAKQNPNDTKPPPKRCQVTPNRPQNGPKAPIWSQNDPYMAQNGPKMARRKPLRSHLYLHENAWKHLEFTFTQDTSGHPLYCTRGVGLKMQIGRTENANAKRCKKNMQLTRETGDPRHKKAVQNGSKNFCYMLSFQGIKCKKFCQEKSRKCRKCKFFFCNHTAKK